MSGLVQILETFFFLEWDWVVLIQLASKIGPVALSVAD